MQRTLLWLLLAALGLVSCSRRRAGGDGPAPSSGPQYPATPTVAVVDEYHGTEVADPYRWLEDVDAPETRAWVEAQNQVTRAYLDALPGRERIRERYEDLLDFERFGVPSKEGGLYFYEHNEGLQDQDVLFVTDDLDDKGRVLIDPNTLSEEGTVALAGHWPSPDGRYLAYGISRAGSDWREIKVRDVQTGEDLAVDHLRWVKFSGAAWSADGRGFFYDRLPAPAPGEEFTAANNQGRQICYHRLGTPQSEDRLVYERPDRPDWRIYSGTTGDHRYLVVWVAEVGSPHNGIFFKDLSIDGPVLELLQDFDARWWPVGNDGTTFFFVTDLDAPNRRVIAIDVEKPGREHWREIVPESRYAIEDVWSAGGRLVVHRLRRAHSQLRLYRYDGTPAGEIELPGLGSVRAFEGRPDDPEAFFGYTSFTQPWTPMRYGIPEGSLETVFEPDVEFDPDDFVSTQVAYRSRDGTWLTMFITHRRDLDFEERRPPALLYGYGGFNVSMTPGFSTQRILWMELGGVWAMPNLRGGGEYGEAWHEAGMRENKQNVFDDFIAAAEALVHNGYAEKGRVAIRGGSNGGLLVGACMTQRPDLFGACIPEVGVMDMLRFHTFTVGEGWTSEYGSADDPALFPVLLAYSPYHNLKPGVRYPPTLVMTADTDDRVVPSHSFKFAARLQAYHAGPEPVLLRVETAAGHGAGTPISKTIDEVTDVTAFLAHELDLEVGRRFWR